MTSQMMLQCNKFLSQCFRVIFFCIYVSTFCIIINMSNANKIVANVIRLHLMSQNKCRCYRLCLCMLCVWDSNHTVVTKSSSAIVSGCCKSIRTRSLHETKAKQIFFCTRLCGEKWPNGCSKAQQWTLRPLIRSMEGKYGAPTHAWTQKNQWKRTQSWHFERLAVMNLPLLITIVALV